MADWQRSAEFAQWPGCGECRYLDLGNIACAAYPNEIPLPIMSGEVDHMVERPGQTPGILFEPRAAVSRPHQRPGRRTVMRPR
jgi:hypothetical protein